PPPPSSPCSPPSRRTTKKAPPPAGRERRGVVAVGGTSSPLPVVHRSDETRRTSSAECGLPHSPRHRAALRSGHDAARYLGHLLPRPAWGVPLFSQVLGPPFEGS